VLASVPSRVHRARRRSALAVRRRKTRRIASPRPPSRRARNPRPDRRAGTSPPKPRPAKRSPGSVTIILAGGGGLETALHTAADLGGGWPFAEIRGALNTARLTNRTPWDLFDDLGTRLGVAELRELAASARLAGDQGARIRASLAAKADSMRAAQTAAIEAEAEAATEKMLLPVVTLVVGMILFIGFGVVQAISTPSTIP
jgi:hypothetical protein